MATAPFKGGIKSRTRAGKMRIRSIDQLDSRTHAYQRAMELRRAIASDVSGGAGEDALPTTLQVAVINAALLAVMTEDAAARWLEGEEVSPSDVATLVNALNRTCGVIGYKRLAKEAVPTLSEYAAQHGQPASDDVEDAEIITGADRVDPDEPAPPPVTAEQAASAVSDFATYLASKAAGQ
ncbi:MAG: hypothetical protein LCH93_01165 [Proteobacteria bacterium]|nr:hypothetical protein [Pseudomonadota bacterium]